MHLCPRMGTMAEWYREAGPLMPAILVVALLGLTVIGERLYAIVFLARVNGRPFIERSIQLVRSGKVDDAIKLCTTARTALSDIGLLILRSRTRDEADLHQIADAAALLLIPRLRRRLRYLPVLAGVACASGVVGVAVGFERAMRAAAAPGVIDRVQAFAGQGAIAFRPLTGGLLVMMLLAAAHAYLASQADTIAEQIREYSARLINALIDRPDVRLGHR